MTLLDYRGPTAAPPRSLLVEKSGDTLTIIWPVLPTWVYWFQFGIVVAESLMSLAGFGAICIALWWLRSIGGTVTLTLLGPVAAASLASALITGWAAWSQWQVRRRWGVVPQTLAIDHDRITLRWLGGRRMRQREWAVNRCADVVVRPVSDVFRRTTVVRVTIRFHDGRPLQLGLAARDPAVVSRAVAELRSAVMTSGPVANPV